MACEGGGRRAGARAGVPRPGAVAGGSAPAGRAEGRREGEMREARPRSALPSPARPSPAPPSPAPAAGGSGPGPHCTVRLNFSNRCCTDSSAVTGLAAGRAALSAAGDSPCSEQAAATPGVQRARRGWPVSPVGLVGALVLAPVPLGYPFANEEIYQKCSEDLRGKYQRPELIIYQFQGLMLTTFICGLLNSPFPTQRKKHFT